MARIEQDIEVNAPIRSVYNQWTQFEEFPAFMEGVRAARQLDDTHVHWCARIGGRVVEWDAEILEQVPDQCVAWRSRTGRLNAGTVEFQPIDGSRTRVRLTMEYEPEGPLESLGDWIGLTWHRVSKDLKKFGEFIEQRGTATGAWRGEVHGGRITGAVAT